MHSTIYQISTEPIAENDYLNIDRIVAGKTPLYPMYVKTPRTDASLTSVSS